MKKSNQNRTYIAIDLKSFYASIECIARGLDPLTANLVVADASRTSKTICLAVTPALKQYGLSGRSRLFEVEAKLREIKKRTGQDIPYIIAPPQMQKYIQYSTRIYQIYLKYVSSEDIHIYSIDEVFIDATDYLNFYKISATELATRMIHEVYSSTGVTATAGIAPNLFLCKVAMDIVAKHMPADEKGVRIAALSIEEYRRKLWNHKRLTDFWGIGRGIAKRLNQNGMYTMGDICLTSLQDLDFLYQLFGINAEIIIDHAWGIEPCTIADIKGYKAKNNCLSHGQVLQSPYSFEKTLLVLKEMCETLSLELVEKGLTTDSITLHISYDRENVDNDSYHGKTVQDYFHRLLPAPLHGTVNFGESISSTSKIVDTVLRYYKENGNPALTVRKLNLTANRVIEATPYQQLDLFSNPEFDKKESNLQKAILELHQRYGKNSLLKGSDLLEGATKISRNGQIGGHKA